MSRAATKRPDEPLMLKEINPSPNMAHVPRALYRALGRERLDLGPRRAITLLWHNAHQDWLAEDKTYAIELSELAAPGHKGTEMPRRIVEKLAETPLTFELPDGPDRSGAAKSLVSPFLVWSDLGARGQAPGVLRYRLPPALVAAAMRSLRHAVVNLRVLAGLTSKYALPLYETLCAVSMRFGEGSVTLPLEDLRTLIGVRRSSYREFNALKREVLAPALDEIAVLMGTRLDLHTQKLGRRVASISIHRWDHGYDPDDEDGAREALLRVRDELAAPRQGRRERVKGTSTQHPPQPSKAKGRRNGGW